MSFAAQPTETLAMAANPLDDIVEIIQFSPDQPHIDSSLAANINDLPLDLSEISNPFDLDSETFSGLFQFSNDQMNLPVLSHITTTGDIDEKLRQTDSFYHQTLHHGSIESSPSYGVNSGGSHEHSSPAFLVHETSKACDTNLTDPHKRPITPPNTTNIRYRMEGFQSAKTGYLSHTEITPPAYDEDAVMMSSVIDYPCPSRQHFDPISTSKKRRLDGENWESGSSWPTKCKRPKIAVNCLGEYQVSATAASLYEFWLSKYPNEYPGWAQFESLAHLTQAKPKSVEMWFSKRLRSGPQTIESDTKVIETCTPRDISSLASSHRKALHHPLGRMKLEASTWVREHKPRKCTRKRKTGSLTKDFGKPYCCTLGCGKTFKDRDDWRKHEEVNYPQNGWICNLGSVADMSGCTLCAFCGISNPSTQHHHEKALCNEKAINAKGRLHFRKQHFCQHFTNVHPGIPSAQYLKSNYFTVQSKFPRRCGFCRYISKHWRDRIEHISHHFTDGKDMSQWDFGVEEDDTNMGTDADDRDPDSDGGFNGRMPGTPDDMSESSDDDAYDTNPQPAPRQHRMSMHNVSRQQGYCLAPFPHENMIKDTGKTCQLTETTCSTFWDSSPPVQDPTGDDGALSRSSGIASIISHSAPDKTRIRCFRMKPIETNCLQAAQKSYAHGDEIETIKGLRPLSISQILRHERLSAFCLWTRLSIGSNLSSLFTPHLVSTTQSSLPQSNGFIYKLPSTSDEYDALPVPQYSTPWILDKSSEDDMRPNRGENANVDHIASHTSVLDCRSYPEMRYCSRLPKIERHLNSRAKFFEEVLPAIQTNFNDGCLYSSVDLLSTNSCESYIRTKRGSIRSTEAEYLCANHSLVSDGIPSSGDPRALLSHTSYEAPSELPINSSSVETHNNWLQNFQQNTPAMDSSTYDSPAIDAEIQTSTPSLLLSWTKTFDLIAQPSLIVDSTLNMMEHVNMLSRSNSYEKFRSKNDSNRDRKRGGRVGPLSPETRKKAILIRKSGACWHCRLTKLKCDTDTVCNCCRRSRLSTLMGLGVLCVRTRMRDYVHRFLPDIITSKYSAKAIKDTICSQIQRSTDNQIEVLVSCGLSYPPILIKATEFVPVNPQLLQLDCTSYIDSKRGAPYLQIPPLMLLEYDLMDIKDKIFRHIKAIIKLPRDIGECGIADTSMLSYKTFEAVNKFRLASRKYSKVRLIKLACKLHAMLYFMSSLLVIHPLSIPQMTTKLQQEHDLPGNGRILASNILDIQIKHQMLQLLQQTTVEVLQGLESTLEKNSGRSPIGLAWVTAVCLMVVICTSLETVQIAVDSILVEALQRGEGIKLSRAQHFQEVQEGVFEHATAMFTYVFLPRKIRRFVNPIRDGLEINERGSITPPMVEFVEDLRKITQEHENDIESRAKDLEFQTKPDDLYEDHLRFRKENSGRLLAKFLQSFVQAS